MIRNKALKKFMLGVFVIKIFIDNNKLPESGNKLC